ncbi:MAG: LytTR family DNA-binding domain-containing protein [Chitinophagaceae bacterium]
MKQFFTFRRGGRTLMITGGNIVTMEAFGSYTEICLLDGSHIRVSKNLKFLLARFSDCDFLVRAHRSWVINLDLVSRLLPGRPCSALLKNGLRIPLGAGICDQISARLELRQQNSPNLQSALSVEAAFCSSLSSGSEWNYLSGDTMGLEFKRPAVFRNFSYTYATPDK